MNVFKSLAAAALCALAGTALAGSQAGLQATINAASDRQLQLDWPIIHIGTGTYEDGPTGVTVFNFAKRVSAAIDVRGGGPGTVNSDYLRLGYEYPEVDAVVFAGGSWYGLETVTAVATALKDDGIRDGNAFSLEPNIALSIGSIIFDFGPRRLNEIYPDKRLAQAAFRAARPGIFPLGAYGAGRFAKTGGFFGCNAYSGQGGAFRQVGKVKIAAFTVVNAFGVITDRDGRVAACYPGAGWPRDLRTTDLMTNFPDSRNPAWEGVPRTDRTAHHNTTVSLIVTNQKLAHAELQRLAVQVHTSMARALQPFATQFDGDVLYAVSTNELDDPDGGPGLSSADLGAVAGEVMWDAVLSSVPKQPRPVPPTHFKPAASALAPLAGDYVFSQFVTVRVSARDGRLLAQAVGPRPAYAIGRDAPVALQPVAADEFTVPGRYPLVLHFDGDRLVINPGHWQQIGTRRH